MSKKDEPTDRPDNTSENEPPRPTIADYDSVPFSNDEKGINFSAIETDD
ncbi:hypothetical protein ACFP8W_07550 [Nocardioides hankookensis]|uniref:Uncharacterized protein n=1 Tax=Nocardioides hankookensis TaxID=443157 RepID=A0ABW1LIM6_9ACTN